MAIPAEQIPKPRFVTVHLQRGGRAEKLVEGPVPGAWGNGKELRAKESDQECIEVVRVNCHRKERKYQ